MRRNLLISVSLFIIVITGLFYPGCSSFQNIELKEEYGFQNKNIITVYVVPSGDEELDDTYARVMYLHLQAFGYKVINANKFINSEKTPWVNHRQTADAILNDSHLPATDIVVVVKARWDSIHFIVNYSEQNTVNGQYVSMSGLNVCRLSSEVAFYDKLLIDPVISFSSVDTAAIMIEKEGSELYYPEYPWMMVAKELSKKLDSLPVCSNNNVEPATNTYKINFWVDKSYRETFPGSWMDRLKLRALYANDILCNQLGIELVIGNFYEWNTYFESSLESMLDKLRGGSNPDPNEIRIGITVNKKLKTNWTDKANLGYASTFTMDAVITAQPYFPGLGLWNPIEEAVTLAHEIGHLFGGLHVTDKSSIMYPSAGSLAYEFDDLNKKIIGDTKYYLLKKDNELKLKEYADNLIQIKNSKPANTVDVLEPMSAAFVNLFAEYAYKFDKPDKLTEFLLTIIPDSAYSSAVAGLVEYHNKNFNSAKKLLTKVTESEPEFAEAHFYLSKILKRLGEDNEAEDHYQAAKPYLKYWVIESEN